MKTNMPAVKVAYPINAAGLKPIPDELDIYSILGRDEIYLYNPFNTGQTVTVESPSSLTFSKLSTAFIVDEKEVMDREGRSRSNELLYANLHAASHAAWPVVKSVFRRLLSLPKRDDGWKHDITPDIGMNVKAPTRKLKGPKKSPKRQPPKPTA